MTSGAQIEALIAHLKSIPNAIVTTHHGRSFDISNGRIGLMDGHEELFLEQICGPFSSIVVRVFSQEISHVIYNPISGKAVPIPKKTVYAYSIMSGHVKPMTARQIETASSIDYYTGRSIMPEKDVYFIDAPAVHVEKI